MFPLEFWLIVSVGAVVVCGLKISLEASGSSAESFDQPPGFHGGNKPDGIDSSSPGPVEPADENNGTAGNPSDDSGDQVADWLVIASANDRETAYEMMAYLNEQGIDAGIREGNAGSPYLEGRSFNNDIPVQIKKRNVSRALECLQQSEFRETLLVE